MLIWKRRQMDKFVAERNVDHYRKLLAMDIDATRRTTVEMLLAIENEKLAGTKLNLKIPNSQTAVNSCWLFAGA
jgi:hypothetical protein